MEEAHFGLGEAAFGGEAQGLTDVAEQHVGALHVFQNLGTESRAEALAIASSTRLSFRPMRRSPVMIFMMYLASVGEISLSSAPTIAPFAAGPRAAETSRNTSWTLLGGCGPHSTSLRAGPPLPGSLSSRSTAPATAPRSPSLRYAAVSSLSVLPERWATIPQSSLPPTCSVVSSHAGNGLPEKNTAATAASATGTDFK